MDKDKFFKGHFKASCDFQSADGKHFVNFGEEFDVSDVLKDNRVEIKHKKQLCTSGMTHFNATATSYEE